MTKCPLCGQYYARKEDLPTERSPCKTCGYAPKLRGKRLIQVGERRADEFLSRSFGFRMNWWHNQMESYQE